MTSKATFTCVYCAAGFSSQQLLVVHLRQHHEEQEEFRETLRDSIEDNDCCVAGPSCETAHDGSFRDYKKDFANDSGYNSLLRDPLSLLRVANAAIVRLLVTCLTSLVSCKFQLCLTVRFERAGRTLNAGFWSAYVNAPSRHDVPRLVEQAYEKIKNAIDAFTQKGSGWVVDTVTDLRIKVGKYDPFRASSFIPLPTQLREKGKYVVNVENRNDNKCFLYSVLAAKHGSYSTDPLNYVQWMDSVDSSMLQYPVELGKIDEFEEKNPRLSINVIAFTPEFGLHPVRVSESTVDRKVVDLLFLSEDKDGESNFHYCWIEDFDGFFRYTGGGHHRKFFCRNCFSGFTREHTLKKHRGECFALNPSQRLRFRKPGRNTLKFERFSRQNPHPWVIYADFECLLQPVTGPLPDPTTRSSTTAIHKHVPNSYGYVVVGPGGEIVEEKYHFGLDAVDHFIQSVESVAMKYGNIIANPRPLALTKEEEDRFELARVCHYCGEGFYPGLYQGEKKKEMEMKVRDHCHFTGRYRGASHNKCNLNAREISTVPVVLHNLEGYDMHLLVAVAEKFEGKVDVIARNAERFQSMSVTLNTPHPLPNNPIRKRTVTLRFIDSLNFLNASLETLVTNLKNAGNEFSILRAGLTRNVLKERLLTPADDRTLDLLTRKGHYPYEYATDMEVFTETELPPREKFFSKLRDEGIGEEEYRHAQDVWELLSTKTFGEYHAVYQMTDVYLLAEVFENFRKLALRIFKLDPCYYLSMPGLSWGAALRQTKVQLELFTHASKHNFITSGIRGGLSYIARRHAVANNRYLPETFDPEKPSIYLMYWDCNNLYGWPMMQKLPHSNFRWLTGEEVLGFEEKMRTLPDDGDYGFILEVDLDYPARLHEEHNDYPLAPESLEIDPSMVSGFSKRVAEEIGHDVKPTTKLCSNLFNKRKYVVHFACLKFYLDQGLKLRRIRRVLAFKQVAWLKPYIEGNTERRQLAVNTFEKDLYKLANNSVFGKTLEQKQNRLSVKLTTDVKKSVKWTSLPHADSFKILNENLISVLLKARSIDCDLPIYSGFAILELSKLLMYRFHYGYVRPKYGDRASLLFTDTDSLFYSIRTDDLYEDMAADRSRFDTSNYPQDHPLYSTENKQVVGKFKDELGGVPISEFVGLRSKMYSYVTAESSKRTAKGISRTFVKKHLSHDDYKRCLEQHTVEKGTWTKIASRDHQLTTNVVTKSLLSPYDDKRWICNDGIRTLAHGHHECTSHVEEDEDFDSDVDLDSDLEAEERRDLEDEISNSEDEDGGAERPRTAVVPTEEERKKSEKWDVRERRREAARETKRRRRRERYAALSEKKKEERRAKMVEVTRKRRAEAGEEGRAAEREREAKKRKEMSEERKREARESASRREAEKRKAMTVEGRAEARESASRKKAEKRKAMTVEERAEANKKRREARKK